MQTLIQKSKQVVGGFAYANNHQDEDPKSSHKMDNQDGFIIVKEGEGVFYVRYDIIFAKAGDIFFMPRKVPKNFSLDSDQVIPFKAAPGEFEKFFNENFIPYTGNTSQVTEHMPTREEIRQFANLSESF